MNRSILILILFGLTMVGCLDKQSTPEYLRNKKELLRIRKKAKQHIPIGDETGIDSLVAFFDENGTDEDIFMAHFYKGWNLFYSANTIQAYACFREAYNLRPKEESETTRDIMRSLFSALQLTSAEEGFSENSEYWWKVADKSGVYTKPYRYLHSYDKAKNMYQSRQCDSCVFYLRRALKEMLENPVWDLNQTATLSELTASFAMMGETDDFVQCNKLLRQHPYHRDNKSTAFSIGLFFQKNGERDSAIYYFNEATKSTDDVALAAYAQLATDARRRGDSEALFECYYRSMQCYDRWFKSKSESYTRKLEAAYQKEELTRQVGEQERRIVISLLSLVGVLLLGVVGWGYYLLMRRKLINTRKSLEEVQKERAVLELQLTQTLEEMQAQKLSANRVELGGARKQLEELVVKMKEYATFRVAAPHAECESFVRLYIDLYPCALSSLREAYPDIKSTDILICLLVYNGFGISQIARITNYERQEIRQFMMRISKGLTGEAIGRMSDFKVMLEERFFGVE